MVTPELTMQVNTLWTAFMAAGVSPLDTLEQITRALADRSYRPSQNATPELRTALIDLLDSAPMQNSTVQTEVYDHLVAKLATSAQSGQSGPALTPNHIMKLMVDLMDPTPDDTIIDPTVGTGGMLVAVAAYVRTRRPGFSTDAGANYGSNGALLTGVAQNAPLNRIATTNLRLHGVRNVAVSNGDPLGEETGVGNTGHGTFSIVLANSPFAGTRDSVAAAKDLLTVVRTKKTELLFLAHSLRLLRDGGRAAVILPDSALFGTSKAHTDARRMLVEDHKLDAVVRLAPGVFKPHSALSTSILLFHKAQTTDSVWFYDVRADGFTLDDNRAQIEADDLPDVVERWRSLRSLRNMSTTEAGDGTEKTAHETVRPRTSQSFVVPKSEIAEQGYDLTFNRYRIVLGERVVHRSANDILIDIARLELRIQQGSSALARALAETL